MRDELEEEAVSLPRGFEMRDAAGVEFEHCQPARRGADGARKERQRHRHRIVVAENDDRAPVECAGLVHRQRTAQGGLRRAGRLVEGHVGGRAHRRMLFEKAQNRCQGRRDDDTLALAASAARVVPGRKAERVAAKILPGLAEFDALAAIEEARQFQLAADRADHGQRHAHGLREVTQQQRPVAEGGPQDQRHPFGALPKVGCGGNGGQAGRRTGAHRIIVVHARAKA